MDRNVKELAQKALGYFEEKIRDDRVVFVYTPKTPKWLKDIIFKAHSNFAPEDYKYKYIYEMIELIANIDEDGDYNCPEIETDIYTSDLTAWLNSNTRRVYYLTNALEECEIKDGFQLLSIAQAMEKEEIYFLVLNGLRDIINNKC